jgi:hypothetical protein
MLDLTSFTLKDMAILAAALRPIGAGAESMEDVAGRIVRHLHGGLVDRQSGRSSCALVRLFKTHRLGDLPVELRGPAGAAGDDAVTPATKCFALLATAGDEPAWNSTELSVGHRAIPLASPKTVGRIPMMADLFRQFGIASALAAWPPGDRDPGEHDEREEVVRRQHAADSQHGLDLERDDELLLEELLASPRRGHVERRLPGFDQGAAAARHRSRHRLPGDGPRPGRLGSGPARDRARRTSIRTRILY